MCQASRASSWALAAAISMSGSAWPATRTMAPSSRMRPSPSRSAMACGRSSRKVVPRSPVSTMRRRWRPWASSVTQSIASAAFHAPAVLISRARRIGLVGPASEIRGALCFVLRRSLGRRQFVHAARQRVEEGQHLVGLHHVGIFGVHVAQIDGVARLRAVEATFLGERDAVIQAEAVEHGGAHAARRGGAGDDEAVAAEQRQVARHVGAEEAGRLLLEHHDVLRLGRDRGDDLVAVEIGDDGVPVLVAARILPQPGAGIPIVVAPHAGGVDDRNTFLMALVDQCADIGQRDPGILAAGIAPALDRFQDRLRPVAAERPIDVDDDERRPLAEAAARAIARRAEHRLVALGEEFVPDRFGHDVLAEWFAGFSLAALTEEINPPRRTPSPHPLPAGEREPQAVRSLPAVGGGTREPLAPPSPQRGEGWGEGARASRLHLSIHSVAFRLSTKLMSMISSYLTSTLRMPAPITTDFAVSQAAGLMVPSWLHMSSAKERASVALRSSSAMVGNCVLAISAASSWLSWTNFNDFIMPRTKPRTSSGSFWMVSRRTLKVE